MENLPTPLSRVELYLAKACGMDVTVPEQPLSRLEQFLAILAGDTSITMPAPASLTEQWLAYVLGVTPEPLLAVEGACLIGAQKVDVRYFARAAGMPGSPDIPEPQNRTEQYWYQIASNVPIVGFLKYATGINLALTDILSGIEELQFVYGDTYQQTYSGKNLFNITSSAKTATRNGVKITIAPDGLITLDGESTGATWPDLTWGIGSNTVDHSTCKYYFPTTISNAVFSLKYVSGTASGGSVTVRLNDNGGVDVNIPFTSPDTFRTMQNVSGINRAYITQLDNGTTFDNFSFYLQIESGSSPTSYEPYVGGTPSPNPDYPQDVQVVTGEQMVTVAGKNLFDKNNVNQYMGYFEGDSDNPSLKSGSTGRNRVIYIKCKPSTAYSISLTTRDGINSPQVGTTDSLPDTGLAVTKLGIFASGSLKLENLTTSATAQYIVIRFQTNPSTVRFDDISQALLAGLQIEQGSTTTAYEPYQGQSYEINLGKNMLDISTFVVGSLSSGNPQPDNKYRINNAANAIPVLPNTKYTISAKLVDPVKGFRVGVHEVAKDGTFIRDLGWKQLANVSSTVTTGDSTYFLKMVCSLSTTSSDVTTGGTENTTACDSVEEFMRGCSLQLEIGKLASPVESYFTPIELCKIDDYQDYIYKSGDDWYLHKATTSFVIDGTKGNYYGTSDWYYVSFSNLGVTNVLGAVPYSSLFTHYAYQTFAGDHTLAGMAQSNSNFVVRNTHYSDAAGYRTWFANSLPKFYYPLATPTDTKITEATLISQLDALDSAVLPKPNANITVTASNPNLPGAIKISYYTRHE